MIIWLAGISGAGKTTLANCLVKKLKLKYPHTICLDGDEIRDLFGNDLGYSKEDRKVQISRIQRVAKFLDQQGAIVVTAALYSSKSITEYNRKNFKNYYEVYLKASIKLVASEDVKKIYNGIMIGKEKNVVGIDIKWNEPKAPDLTLNRDTGYVVENAAENIIENIKSKI